MGEWTTIEAAAERTGVSTRTIQRRIKLGELVSRIEAGRREVFIDAPRAGGDTATATDNLAVTVAERAQAHAEALAVMSDRLGTLADARVGELRTDLDRARRFGWAGWGVALVAVSGIVVGALLVPRLVRDADARAIEADARARVLEAQAERDRGRADELERALIELAKGKADATAPAPDTWPPVPYPNPTENALQSLDDR